MIKTHSKPIASAIQNTTKVELTEETCQKTDKIFYLKTTKTGSTSLANIIMRFGFKRIGTNFLFRKLSQNIALSHRL